ncbi:hypothetical protein MHH42_31275 [Bacillus sp. FSL L8-0099]|uniref:hypothetical protein n=1 Tax=unclassified Bacillus (in: firmicutes) TaxID=185979 RepID=UPI0030F81A47
MANLFLVDSLYKSYLLVAESMDDAIRRANDKGKYHRITMVEEVDSHKIQLNEIKRKGWVFAGDEVIELGNIHIRHD